jgi:hypothetical protein
MGWKATSATAAIRDRELDASDLAVEGVVDRGVIRGHRGTRILADIGAVIGGEHGRQRRVHVPLADLLAVGEQSHFASFARATTGVGELHADLVLPGGERILGLDDEGLETAPVVAVGGAGRLRFRGPPRQRAE